MVYRDPPPSVRALLEPWCAVGATGALRVGDPPGGALYLVDGRLVYAECPQTNGVDRLLVASGRLTAEAWRSAVAAGRSGRSISEFLVEHDHLNAAELELTVLAALYDAALLLFERAAEAQFEAGVTHHLGTVCAIDFDVVCTEVDRRRGLLADAWHDPAIDTAAIVPARRLGGHHVALNAVQWEIIANADRRRSPVDLARLLGRETFVVRLEMRRLAHAGLVEPGRANGATGAEPAARGRARTAGAADRPVEEPEQAAPTGSRRRSHRAATTREAADERAAVEPDEPVELEPLLPRRPNGEIAPWRSGLPVPGPPPGPAIECSEGTLLRIRRGLDRLR